MDKKKQQMRLSDIELELLKSTFAGRDGLLLTLRNLFFGLEVTEEEKKEIKATFSSPALRKLMRKQFLPEFQSDIPIGQNIDLYMLADVKGKTVEQIMQEYEATLAKSGRLEDALSKLENLDAEFKPLEFISSNDLQSDLAGRNQFVTHVDRQLQTIEVLAGQKDESVSETKERLLRDSTK